MRELVPAALADQRLDRVLSMATGLSRSRIQELLAAGAVLVDGRPESRPARRLAAGQVVEVDLPAPPTERPVGDPAVDFTVVHEDDWLLVVDKPAGLVVHTGAGHLEGTLVNGLLARYPELAGVGDSQRPGIVHRLDKGTSGLMVVARTDEAFHRLVRMMAAREVSRRYLALVHGLVAADEGLVDAPVGRSSRQPTRMAVSASGRDARTGYVVLVRFPDPGVTLLECRLESGRTHQIRVHLSAIGHPVVGDDQYRSGRRETPGPGPGLDRPFLHAHRLAFDHPDGRGRLELVSELPAELEEWLRSLGAGRPGPGATPSGPGSPAR